MKPFALSVRALALAVACLPLAARAMEAPILRPARAAVFSEALARSEPALARELAAELQRAGYEPEFITLEVLTNQARLTVERYELLALL